MVSARKYYWVVFAVLLASLVLLFNYHIGHITVPVNWQTPINLIAFSWLCSTVLLAHANQQFKRRTDDDLNKFNVCVVIPAYNEDPLTFRAMLDSLNKQTRLPDFVYISDDGSKSKDCLWAYKEWAKTTAIQSRYYKHKNMGKREAQAFAFRRMKDADIFVTIDSDTVLDEKAIENGIVPFFNPKVMSVAGLLLGLNYNANLITRLTEIGFITSFLNGRAAWSRLRSVAVNCGGLAFYRGTVVRKYLNEYTTQKVFGQTAKSGDDRIMTNFALLEGWAVYQENSVGYTLLPVKLKHLLKQRVRWWRSFFWGGVWLVRRFNPNRIVWWLVTWQFCSFVLYTIIFATVLIGLPFHYHDIPLLTVGYLIILSYVRNARYLSIKRPDITLMQQIGMYLLSPLSSVLYFFLCTCLQYVGLATVNNMGWATRKKVEVTLKD